MHEFTSCAFRTFIRENVPENVHVKIDQCILFHITSILLDILSIVYLLLYMVGIAYTVYPGCIYRHISLWYADPYPDANILPVTISLCIICVLGQLRNSNQKRVSLLLFHL